MSAISTHEIEEFLNGALVTWLESCLPRPELLSGYPSLLDGTLIHSVWLQIDPAPQHNPMKLINLDENVLGNARSKNFDSIVRNLKTIYEEELGQTILLLPDCSILGNSPETRNGLDQMKLLLTLLLGAAVQCPNKQTFINGITELDVQTQHSIVELIKQVTDSQSLVLTCESLEHLESQQMFSHIIRIARERDKYHSNWIQNLLIEPADLHKSTNNSIIINSTVSGSTLSASSSSSLSASASSSSSKITDNNHMAVELADLKSKLRKNRQELEEKSESFMELKEELEHKNSQYEKLRLESQEWYAESRRASAYRDEVDVLRERSERADRLEIEVQRFREKLSDAEFFKTRVEELREDNRTLLETKDMLEEQLLRSRKRSEHTITLETEIIKYKQKLNDIALERDVDKNKLQELLDENTQLQLATRNLYGIGGLDVDNRMSHSDNEDDCASGDNSLSEQLTNNAQTRALKLELENRRLQQSLDAIKESAFHESAMHTLELEKDKKRLLLKVEQFQENINRLQQQNKELENVFKNALEENCKLQQSIDARKLASEKQLQDRETERLKLIDVETHVETLTKEKQRVQTLCESVQRRADDLERVLDVKTKDFDSLQVKAIGYDSMKNNLSNLNDKLSQMEKENGNLSREIVKLRVNLESKDVQLDENVSKIDVQLREIQKLTKEIERHELNAPKRQELEIRNNELESQMKINRETIDTLQKDLVDGTIGMEKIKKELEKLGVVVDDGRKTVDTINLNVENVIENLVKNPETFKTVREIMLNYVTKEVIAQSPTSTSPSSTTSTSTMDSCIFCHNKGKSYTVEKQIDIVNANNNSNNNDDGCRDAHIDFIADFYENGSGNNNKSPHKNNIEISIATQQQQRKEQQYEQLLATIGELQQANETLQTDNVRHKVDVSTMSTQIQSLNTQHVALQLANSQLAAEKDGLLKRLELFKQQSDALLHDQVTLQCLHEQLSAEYEGLSKEKEMIKSNCRDLRIENRDLRERELALLKQIEDLQTVMDVMKKENENFCNLRGEHSKLKDDFRNLFTTSERLKHEYKNVQEQYKIIRSENGNLKLQCTEINGELNGRADQMKSFEIEYTKVLNHCEMLQQMNSNLDTDRRSLMDHVSQLLAQYHELLSHSLEDKQHYHDEEKLFTDKVNNLHRQKEKLEEKIMEHYRKLENCSPKKKPFGSSFVKKVKKAGSDIINRVPHRNRRSWMEDARLTQSQFTLGSESGGNDESDNSNEEPNSIASDTNLILQRNSHLRQSLQRRPSQPQPQPPPPLLPNDKLDNNLLIRGGLRSSVQTLRREHSPRTIHRHSVHGLESPDVTGSSLTLGTAGSRRTVYLIDDNPNKLTDNKSQTSTTTTSTSTTTTSSPQITGTATAATTSSPSAAAATITSSIITTTMGPNKNVITSGSGSSLPPGTIQSQNNNNNNNTSNNSTNNNNATTTEDGQNNQPPSTFVMYNRISNVIGNIEKNQNSGLMTTTDTKSPPPPAAAHPTTIIPTGSSMNESKVKDKKRDDKDKETAIWYEYGCV